MSLLMVVDFDQMILFHRARRAGSSRSREPVLEVGGGLSS